MSYRGTLLHTADDACAHLACFYTHASGAAGLEHAVSADLETAPIPATLGCVAQVITDPVNGRSKSYGFVRFSNEEQRNRALKEMGGMLIAGKPIRVSLATAKKGPAAGGALGMPPIPGMPPAAGLAGMVRPCLLPLHARSTWAPQGFQVALRLHGCMPNVHWLHRGFSGCTAYIISDARQPLKVWRNTCERACMRLPPMHGWGEVVS